MPQLLGHQAGIAGGREQVFEAGQQFLASGGAGRQPSADPGPQRDEFVAAQFIEEPAVATEHHTQQGLGVEPSARQEAQLREHHRRHLLGLVDEDDGPAGSGLQVIEPSCAQRFEPAPAVADPDGDGEDVAELAIEVAQVALRMMDDADREVGQAGQAARRAGA